MGGGHSRNTDRAPAQRPETARDATGGTAAPTSFMSLFSRNTSRPPVWRTHDDSVHHPILSVFELERLLYTGKTACNHADEVWPGLYLGDQYVLIPILEAGQFREVGKKQRGNIVMIRERIQMRKGKKEPMSSSHLTITTETRVSSLSDEVIK